MDCKERQYRILMHHSKHYNDLQILWMFSCVDMYLLIIPILLYTCPFLLKQASQEVCHSYQFFKAPGLSFSRTTSLKNRFPLLLILVVFPVWLVILNSFWFTLLSPLITQAVSWNLKFSIFKIMNGLWNFLREQL